MSRRTTRVDAVALSWIARQPQPAAMLRAVVAHFARSSGRVGYVITGEAAGRMGGGINDAALSTFTLREGGTLTCRLEEAGPPGLGWDAGDLTLTSAEGLLPETIVAACGRRLGEIVAHPLLPPRALVVRSFAEAGRLVLECQEFSMQYDEALATLESGVLGEKA